jgi:GNAT superfamily N-acetyltransferase
MPSIRLATPDDAPALASLLGELGYPSDADQLRGRMARVRPDDVFVAVDERAADVVGMLSLHQFSGLHDDAPVALITALVVAERTRGLGVGRQLVDRAVEAARGWGCTRLMVTTHVRRPAAHAFYEHVGFELTGRRYVKAL